MAILSHVVLLRTHIILAAFMFPVATMFLVTGALYTWGFVGAYEEIEVDLVLKKPLKKDLISLKKYATTALNKEGFETPTGWAGIVESGQDFRLEWRGFNRNITLKPMPGFNALTAKLIIHNSSLYRKFVLLHKAEGGTIFKIYATIFSAVLFFMLLIGYTLAWQLNKYRKLTLISTLSSIFFFAIIIMMAAT